MSLLTRDGTAEPVLRDQILRRERGRENSTTSRIGNLALDPYSAVCDDHTYLPMAIDPVHDLVLPGERLVSLSSERQIEKNEKYQFRKKRGIGNGSQRRHLSTPGASTRRYDASIQVSLFYIHIGEGGGMLSTLMIRVFGNAYKGDTVALGGTLGGLHTNAISICEIYQDASLPKKRNTVERSLRSGIPSGARHMRQRESHETLSLSPNPPLQKKPKKTFETLISHVDGGRKPFPGPVPKYADAMTRQGLGALRDAGIAEPVVILPNIYGQRLAGGCGAKPVALRAEDVGGARGRGRFLRTDKIRKHSEEVWGKCIKK